MFYLAYLSSELRRRAGRTLITALGLGVGVGLVAAVAALSSGLDDAQDKVLEPLTGVGTDMSATRPLDLGSGGFQNLSGEEREQLQQENRGLRTNIAGAADPGERFTVTRFISTTQLSFPATEVASIAGLDDVDTAAGSLTLSATTISGRVPESGTQGVVNVAYAKRNGIDVGDTLALKGDDYRVVGLSRSPLGGQASDVYVKLDQLQKASGRDGRVNTVLVRADSAGDVDGVAKEIRSSFEGSSVTTSAGSVEVADAAGGGAVIPAAPPGRRGRGRQFRSAPVNPYAAFWSSWRSTTRSASPYSTASSAVRKRSRSMSECTCSID